MLLLEHMFCVSSCFYSQQVDKMTTNTVNFALYLKLDILYFEIQDCLSCGRVILHNVKCDQNDPFLFFFYTVHILELHTQELI